MQSHCNGPLRTKKPISGLYAAADDMTSVKGSPYPGLRITIGPDLTFGYIAARHAASTVR